MDQKLWMKIPVSRIIIAMGTGVKCAKNDWLSSSVNLCEFYVLRVYFKRVIKGGSGVRPEFEFRYSKFGRPLSPQVHRPFPQRRN